MDVVLCVDGRNFYYNFLLCICCSRYGSFLRFYLRVVYIYLILYEYKVEVYLFVFFYDLGYKFLFLYLRDKK